MAKSKHTNMSSFNICGFFYLFKPPHEVYLYKSIGNIKITMTINSNLCPPIRILVFFICSCNIAFVFLNLFVIG